MRLPISKSIALPAPYSERHWRISLTRLAYRLKGRGWLTGVGLFGVFVLVLSLIQFSTPNLVGNDGYYHIKLAQIMRLQGLRPDFTWLPLTILNAEAYVNHHFLYHVIMMPFTFGDLRVGAKWVSVIIPAVAFLAGWNLLRGQRVPLAAIWALGFVVISEAFLYRMSMPRAQSASLLVLFLGLHALLSHHHKWLLPISFAYVWLYDAFPLMVILVGAYLVARLLFERHLDLKPMVYTVAGIGLGLLINPYFPENLIFIYHHILPKIIDPTSTNVGSEWQPYSTWGLAENSGPALILFGLGIFALGLNNRRMNVRTATALFLALFFGLMLFKSRRFVEYFPPFALIFAAFAWQPLLQRWLVGKPWSFKLDLRLNQKQMQIPFLDIGRPERMRLLATLMLVLCLTALSSTVQASQESLQRTGTYERYADAATWLAANSPAESRVFQLDWDDFPKLFFYNSHNRYMVGLDPTYMQLYDADLYNLWVDITQGRVAYPAQTIATTFEGDYVFSDLNHEAFLAEAAADPGLVEIYRDQYAVIFAVVVD